MINKKLIIDRNSKGQRFITGILQLILPVANPDFDNKIDSVFTWLIEFSEDGIPLKEIGLDINGKPIVKMPYRRNIGYWVDIGMHISKFKKRFQVEEITQANFNNIWNSFDTK